MVDLSEVGVVAWFAPVRPAARQNNWPAAIRPIESRPAVQPLLEELGEALSSIAHENLPVLPEALASATLRHDLQSVIAQLGAARLLRLTEWIATSLPNAPQILAELSQGRTANAHAIRSSLRAQIARASLLRMFSPGRVAELQSCVETAITPQEIL